MKERCFYGSALAVISAASSDLLVQMAQPPALGVIRAVTVAQQNDDQ
jgi:hypothetical protein